MPPRVVRLVRGTGRGATRHPDRQTVDHRTTPGTERLRIFQKSQASSDSASVWLSGPRDGMYSLGPTHQRSAIDSRVAHHKRPISAVRSAWLLASCGGAPLRRRSRWYLLRVFPPFGRAVVRSGCLVVCCSGGTPLVRCQRITTSCCAGPLCTVFWLFARRSTPLPSSHFIVGHFSRQSVHDF